GGHPYLTQRLCRGLADELSSLNAQRSTPNASGVDALVHELFLSPLARERDDNLLFVREQLMRRDFETAALLGLYAQVRAQERVPDDEHDPLVGALRLSG